LCYPATVDVSNGNVAWRQRRRRVAYFTRNGRLLSGYQFETDRRWKSDVFEFLTFPSDAWRTLEDRAFVVPAPTPSVRVVFVSGRFVRAIIKWNGPMTEETDWSLYSKTVYFKTRNNYVGRNALVFRFFAFTNVPVCARSWISTYNTTIQINVIVNDFHRFPYT